MTVIKKYIKRMREMSFRLQLSLLFILGFAIIVIAASLATTWLASRLITEDTINEGKTITKAFAKQSSLALLTQSKENAIEASENILSFSNVKQVAVFEKNNNLLYQSGDLVNWKSFLSTNSLTKPEVEYEDSQHWQFIAPVLIASEYIDDIEYPFEEQQATSEQLYGFVKVLISKEELNTILTNIVIGNISIIIFIATILFLILQRLIVQMTQPLQSLADTMHMAEEGEINLRVDLFGSNELTQMSKAFNKMMAVIEEREKELTSTRDRALESVRIKSEFTANVSHELRTPMNGILGMLNLLLETDINEEQREFIKTASESGDVLLTLINDILDFSKITAGQLSLEETKIDLRAVIESVIKLHAKTPHGSKLEINCLFDLNLPKLIYADATRIRQLFNNLIGNAVKFTGFGDVTITVNIIDETIDTLWVKAEIMDTGIGIAAADQQKIFESFSQKDSASNREYGGAGLGLSIVKEIITLMKGTIELKSDTGEGTTFTLTLPLKKISKDKVISEKKPIKNLDINALVIAPSGIYLRVVEQLCDECQINHSWLSEINTINDSLEHAASSGKEFSIVFINWPGSTAYIWKKINEIKSNSAYSKLKIIQLISNKDKPDEPIDPVVDIIIDKPLTKDEIINNLPAIINKNIEIKRTTVQEDKSKNNSEKKTEKETEKQPNKSEKNEQTDDNSTNKAIKDKILVVEDNDVNQKVILATLKKLRLSADLAKNGEVAVESVRRERYAAILMDCQMPVMSGYEATLKIREMETHNNRIPIIALTANASRDDKEKCLAHGMDDFISKPFTIQRMANVLGHWLKTELTIDNNSNKKPK